MSDDRFSADPSFGGLFDLFDSAAATLDAHARILRVNPFFASVLSKEPAELAGRSVSDFVPADLARRLSDIVDQAQKSPGLLFRVEGDFQPFPARRLTVASLQEKDSGAVVTYILFLSEPPGFAMDSARQGSLLSFAEYISDLIYITDEKGKIRYVNRWVIQKTGLSLEDLQKRSIVNYVHEEDRKEFVDILEEARRGRQGSKRGLRVFHKDGRLLRLNVSYGPITVADGSFRGVIGIAQDATREYNLEARVQRSRNLEMLRSLAESIAGDFHTILTGLLSNIRLLRVQTDKQMPALRYILYCEEAALRANGLTQQLLALTRSGMGQPRPIDLNMIIGELVQRVREQHGDNLILSFLPGSGIGHVYADPAYIRLMMNNILQNSEEAIPGGGVIEIRIEKHVIGPKEISEIPKGEYVKICISDDGIGIEAENLGRVMEPFFTTKSLSRGIGLSAVEGIVTNLKGHIDIASKIGEGTTVTILLPVLSAISLPSPPERAPSTARYILAGDKDKKTREFCAAVFRSLGCEVALAESIDEIFEIMDRQLQPFDIVLMEADMSIARAEQLFRRVRAGEPDARIVLTTRDHDLRRSLEEVAVFDERTNILAKPLSLQALTALLDIDDGTALESVGVEE